MKNNKTRNARKALISATNTAVSKMRTGIETSVNELLLMADENLKILQSSKDKKFRGI